mgnify:CR=1 FL=1
MLLITDDLLDLWAAYNTHSTQKKIWMKYISHYTLHISLGLGMLRRGGEILPCGNFNACKILCNIYVLVMPIYENQH